MDPKQILRKLYQAIHEAFEFGDMLTAEPPTALVDNATFFELEVLGPRGEVEEVYGVTISVGRIR